MKTSLSTYQEAADFLAGLIPDMPQTAIILGSGLDAGLVLQKRILEE